MEEAWLDQKLWKEDERQRHLEEQKEAEKEAMELERQKIIEEKMQEEERQKKILEWRLLLDDQINTIRLVFSKS